MEIHCHFFLVLLLSFQDIICSRKCNGYVNVTYLMSVYIHISQGKQLDPCKCVEEALQCLSLSLSAKEVG